MGPPWGWRWSPRRNAALYQPACCAKPCGGENQRVLRSKLPDDRTTGRFFGHPADCSGHISNFQQDQRRVRVLWRRGDAYTSLVKPPGRVCLAGLCQILCDSHKGRTSRVMLAARPEEVCHGQVVRRAGSGRQGGRYPRFSGAPGAAGRARRVLRTCLRDPDQVPRDVEERAQAAVPRLRGGRDRPQLRASKSCGGPYTRSPSLPAF